MPLEPEHTMLLHWLRQATEYGSFQLRSGEIVDTYCDVRRVCCEVPGRALIGDLLAHELDPFHPVSVGGLGIGGILVSQAVAHHRRCASFIFRDQPKHYGRVPSSLLEGILEPDDRVAIVEDVITTGGSALTACSLAESLGARVVAVAAVLDRGGRAAIEAAGYPVIAITTLQDIECEKQNA